MVPAYHAVLDAYLEGGHDDPQGFNLEAWALQIREIVGEIKK